MIAQVSSLSGFTFPEDLYGPGPQVNDPPNLKSPVISTMLPVLDHWPEIKSKASFKPAGS